MKQKISTQLVNRLKEMGLVDETEWESARIRRCRSGKHQLGLGFWSWEVDFLRGNTCSVIGSTSTMGECNQSKELLVNVSGGFIAVEPIEYN
jgi:hypothetical protein